LVATSSVRRRGRGSREVVMSLFLTRSVYTRLRQGGVGDANRSGRPLCRSTAFASMPRGTDTARPADRA
jgi:hypothetical protein